MRSQSLLVFFVICFTALLLAILAVDIVVALMMHDRVLWASAAEAFAMPLVFAGGSTIGEASRRRRERRAQ